MPGFPGAVLEAFDDTHFGYGRMTITPTEIRFEYVTVVPRPHVASGTVRPTVIDQSVCPGVSAAFQLPSGPTLKSCLTTAMPVPIS